MSPDKETKEADDHLNSSSSDDLTQDETNLLDEYLDELDFFSSELDEASILQEMSSLTAKMRKSLRLRNPLPINESEEDRSYLEELYPHLSSSIQKLLDARSYALLGKLQEQRELRLLLQRKHTGNQLRLIGLEVAIRAQPARFIVHKNKQLNLFLLGESKEIDDYVEKNIISETIMIDEEFEPEEVREEYDELIVSPLSPDEAISIRQNLINSLRDKKFSKGELNKLSSHEANILSVLAREGVFELIEEEDHIEIIFHDPPLKHEESTMSCVVIRPGKSEE
ncbi:MAG: hypothetical protein KAR35_08865 [Candidatus Heimdallarchaeota archaeon]|nr:hypothetical protein [Candidatus Heimdallarchaeota archaeon]MCK5049467.1 hypothetical protein [Candidatus Heimdallarchaeota archaeon]